MTARQYVASLENQMRKDGIKSPFEIVQEAVRLTVIRVELLKAMKGNGK